MCVCVCARARACVCMRACVCVCVCVWYIWVILPKTGQNCDIEGNIYIHTSIVFYVSVCLQARSVRRVEDGDVTPIFA